MLCFVLCCPSSGLRDSPETNCGFFCIQLKYGGLTGFCIFLWTTLQWQLKWKLTTGQYKYNISLYRAQGAGLEGPQTQFRLPSQYYFVKSRNRSQQVSWISSLFVNLGLQHLNFTLWTCRVGCYRRKMLIHLTEGKIRRAWSQTAARESPVSVIKPSSPSKTCSIPWWALARAGTSGLSHRERGKLRH